MDLNQAIMILHMNTSRIKAAERSPSSSCTEVIPSDRLDASGRLSQHGGKRDKYGRSEAPCRNGGIVYLLELYLENTRANSDVAVSFRARDGIPKWTILGSGPQDRELVRLAGTRPAVARPFCLA